MKHKRFAIERHDKMIHNVQLRVAKVFKANLGTLKKVWLVMKNLWNNVCMTSFLQYCSEFQEKSVGAKLFSQ